MMDKCLQTLLLTACAVITSAQIPGQDFLIFATTTSSTPTIGTRPTARSTGDFVLINNMPVLATMAPFVDAAPAPTPEFLDCYGRCPTTAEYNPICGSNRQLYLNEQKFNCARYCGADVQIVRRGSCQGLFPMQRG
ncbi:uncharacterized protein LOC117787690 [Drosophila innubila]|uniref:uncharacterized protein LOC117787690 n=1 Tax=Drosophila innubila TaxID=198719 RepID=UPI00148E402C|nr:uncharacterized protein LOC117787690 [Drosophila innubila]